MTRDGDLLDDVVVRLSGRCASGWGRTSTAPPRGRPCTLLLLQSSMRQRSAQVWVGFPA